jgi:WD40 repeat protein
MKYICDVVHRYREKNHWWRQFMYKYSAPHFVLFLLLDTILILLLSSCSPTQTAPTFKPIETRTQTSTAPLPTTQPEPQHTRTPDLTRPDTVRPTYAADATQRSMLPTPTPISLGTPVSENLMDEPLTEEGPWLIYRSGDHSETLFLINANGTGREIVEIPKVLENSKLLPSHNSDYFAIYQYSDEATEVVIYIFHAPEIKIVETIDLVSYPGLIGSDASHALHTGTEHVFWYYEPAWSPDGRYLAFLGAIDGPSSDVYVYDTVTDHVQRLTSGENHAANLKWSPDSLWIVHSEVESFDMGCCDVATWAVSTNGEVILNLYEPLCDQILAWIDSSTFMSTDRTLTANRDVRIVDLHQGQISYPFKGWFTNVAFDPIQFILLLDPRPEYSDTPDYPQGIYFLSAASPSLMMLESEYRGWLWNTHFKRIISEDLECEEGTIAALLEDGTYECIEKHPMDLLWSPSGEWGVPRETKNKIYDENYTLIRNFMNAQAEEFLWSPDSTGLFLIASGQLVYLEPPDGDLQMIDNRNPSELSWIGVD